MTKKDYIIVAQAIKNAFGHGRRFEFTEEEVLQEIIDEFARLAEIDNPKFNKAIFEKYIKDEDF